jgi:hypothetical protein
LRQHSYHHVGIVVSLLGLGFLSEAKNSRIFDGRSQRRTAYSAAYRALLGQVEAYIKAGAFQWLSQDGDILLRVRHVYQNLPASVFLGGADAIHLAAAESGFRMVYSK